MQSREWCEWVGGGVILQCEKDRTQILHTQVIIIKETVRTLTLEIAGVSVSCQLILFNRQIQTALAVNAGRSSLIRGDRCGILI